MSNIKFNQQEVSLICEQLALLTHAGIGLSDGFLLLSEQDEDKEHQKIFKTIADDMDMGVSFAEAMEKSACFPEYAVGLISIGDQTGHTEEVLHSLAEYYESRVKLDHRVRSALMYPSILLMLMLIVIIVLLVKVMPVFNDVYASLGSSLTGIASGLLIAGRVLDQVLPVLCVLLGAAVIFVFAFSSSEAFREKCIAFWRSKSGDRGFSRKLNNARTAQALMMGMKSGLNMEESLAMAAKLLEGSPEAVKRCRKCEELLMDGSSLPEALNSTGVLDPSSCRLLSLGIRSGNADEVMAEIAGRLANEADEDLDAKVSMIEPTLVIVTSLIVGAILLSVMLPLMNIMSAIG